ncbi:hypothetical protein L0222_07120 [bacterium]|nr:hypothetical protein [bacterium]
MASQPSAWRFSTRGIAVRLFFTCWILYALHFATNIVREIYLAASLGDHCSFRVDEYAGLHPDLFEKKGYGWHINNNPGASMIASLPYFLNRFWIDPLVDRVRNSRSASGSVSPPHYDSPWPMARKFYAQAWQRGLDIKLGLAALVMQVFCMAPLSAAGVVMMFYVLRRIFDSNRIAFWLSILYGFATPIFFRTGTLNQNLMTAHIVFAGFTLLWNPATRTNWKVEWRFTLAGLAGGLAVLLDYSGVILLTLLFVYGWFKNKENRLGNSLLFIASAFLPILLLWFYQWRSFGRPFYPPQYLMPVINPWVETGFRGFVGPRPHLMWSLLFDYRYGLFLSCPLLLLAPFSFLIRRYNFPRLEKTFFFLFFLGLWIFFSGVNYTNLQFNTGIRYLVAIVPFLFIPAVMVLMALPRALALLVSLVALFQSWCLAMYRDVERGSGILEPVKQILSDGLELPVFTTLSRMQALKELLPFGASPLPVFLVTACVLYFTWRRSGHTRDELHL